MIVTIAREFGSGGRDVARSLAGRLKYHLVDQELIAAVARQSGAPYYAAAEWDETTENLLFRMAVVLTLGAVQMGGPATATGLRAKTALELTQQLIRKFADEGNVVILGRGGAALLRDRPQALHAFLYAPLEWRAPQVAQREKISVEDARLEILRMDRQRAHYLKTFYHQEWRDPTLYDLCINMQLTGVEGAAELLEYALSKLPATTKQAA